MTRKLIAAFLLALMLFGTASTRAPIVAQSETFTDITWEFGADQKKNLDEAQSVVVAGKLYVFGGFDSLKSCCTPTRRVHVYEPDRDRWLEIKRPDNSESMPKGVTHSGFATDGLRYVYYAGGYVENASQNSQVFGTREAWRYDVVDNTYTALPLLPVNHAAGMLAFLDDKLYLMGGTNIQRTIDLDTLYILDLNNLAAGWSQGPSFGEERGRHHAGVAVMDGMIYYIAGQKNHDGPLVSQNKVDRYDPETNTWAVMADMPVAQGRNHAGFTTFPYGDRILVLGGQTSHNSQGLTATDTVFAYTPATDTWEELAPMELRQHSAVGGVIDGKIYFSGGVVRNSDINPCPEGKDGCERRRTRIGTPILIVPTPTPTEEPTEEPTTEPTVTATTTEEPTTEPTVTTTATEEPTTEPTVTTTATEEPTTEPTVTTTATEEPTTEPTVTTTPTATATEEPTTEPTVTTTATATATPTEEPAGVELLDNGGFEDGLTSWKLKNPTKDKVKQNKPAKDKVFSHTGDAAFMFKGAAGKNAKLMQVVDLDDIPFSAGDSLTFSFVANSKKAPQLKYKVVVKYADSAEKTKINGNVSQSDGYVPYSGVASLVTANVNKIKVNFADKSASGKVFIDDASLILAGNDALLPLPSTH